MAYVDMLSEVREKDGLPPLTKSEQTIEWQNAVDLIVDESALSDPARSGQHAAGLPGRRVAPGDGAKHTSQVPLRA